MLNYRSALVKKYNTFFLSQATTKNKNKNKRMKLTNNTSICYWVTWSALDVTSSVIYEWTAAFTSERKLS